LSERTIGRQTEFLVDREIVGAIRIGRAHQRDLIGMSVSGHLTKVDEDLTANQKVIAKQPNRQ
jgi:hypothetical protein